MDGTEFLEKLTELVKAAVGQASVEPGGPDRCACPDCDYETDKKRGIPCRAMTCPECGAELVAAVEKASREELRTARDQRAKKYGIAAKEGGHLTPPKGYPTNEASFADPVNYVYPIDGDHIQAAVSYFNHEGQREAGGYSSAEWAIVGKRVASAASNGRKYEYRDGRVQRQESKAKKSFYVPIAKSDEVKRLVYGIVQEPDEFDSQNDRISAEEIEKACHLFMIRSQQLDLEHQRDLRRMEAAIVENYIAPQELTWGNTVVKAGSWVMVTKVFSDIVWKQVQKGELTGYSIKGWGVRKRIG